MRRAIERPPETEMDLGASARARIVRELFCTFAACRTPLLHHSLRNLGDVSCALHSDFRCRPQRLSLGRVDRTLIPPRTATPCRITCPSAGTARESTECPGQ